MTGPAADGGAEQPLGFLLLYALAVAGGSVAYVPFLTILLPLRIASLAPADAVWWLSAIGFAGAVAASLANIAFGWLSDATGTRRLWIAVGAALSGALLLAMGQARSAAALLGLVVAWQVALNMMLAPLLAWGGDLVPDGQKGLLGGLLAFAPATGALAGALVTLPGLAGPDARLALVAALVTLAVAPALLLGGGRVRPQLMAPAAPARQWRTRLDGLAARMWLARLLVQLAEAALFVFLLVWLRTLDPALSDNDAALLFTGSLMLSIPLALTLGRWSDGARKPLTPLAGAAMLAAAGLLVMASATRTGAAMAGYLLFATAAAVFLALHSSQTLRVLPAPRRRGRDLGLFNLTNTVPSLIMPALALALVPMAGFAGLFGVLAVLALLSAALLGTGRKA